MGLVFANHLGCESRVVGWRGAESCRSVENELVRGAMMGFRE